MNILDFKLLKKGTIIAWKFKQSANQVSYANNELYFSLIIIDISKPFKIATKNNKIK